MNLSKNNNFFLKNNFIILLLVKSSLFLEKLAYTILKTAELLSHYWKKMYFAVICYSLLLVSNSQLSMGSLTPTYGHTTHTSAQFLCLWLSRSSAFRKAVATPWQQKPLIVSHTGIVAVNVTLPLAQSQRVKEHIPSFCMKNRTRARPTRTRAGNKGPGTNCLQA